MWKRLPGWFPPAPFQGLQWSACSSWDPLSYPFLLDFLQVKVDSSWAWMRWSLKIMQLFWPPFLFSIISHRALQSRSLKQPKYLLKSTVMILFFDLFFPLRILAPPSHGHHSTGCFQPSHPWLFLLCLWVSSPANISPHQLLNHLC